MLKWRYPSNICLFVCLTLTVGSSISKKPVPAVTNFARAVRLVVTCGISVAGGTHIHNVTFCNYSWEDRGWLYPVSYIQICYIQRDLKVQFSEICKYVYELCSHLQWHRAEEPRSQLHVAPSSSLRVCRLFSLHQALDLLIPIVLFSFFYFINFRPVEHDAAERIW